MLFKDKYEAPYFVLETNKLLGCNLWTQVSFIYYQDIVCTILLRQRKSGRMGITMVEATKDESTKDESTKDSSSYRLPL